MRVNRRDFLKLAVFTGVGIVTGCAMNPDDEGQPSSIPTVEANRSPETEILITDISDIDFAVALTGSTALGLSEARARQLVLYQTGIKTKGIIDLTPLEPALHLQPPKWGLLKGTMAYTPSEPYAILVDLNVDPNVNPYTQYRWLKVALGPQEAAILERNIEVTRASLTVSGFTADQAADMVRMTSVTLNGHSYSAMLSKHFGQSISALQKAGATLDELGTYYRLAAVRGYQLYENYRFFQWDPNPGNISVRPLPDGTSYTVINHDFTNTRLSTRQFSVDFADRIRVRYAKHAHRMNINDFPTSLDELRALSVQNPTVLAAQTTAAEITGPVSVIENNAQVIEVVGVPQSSLKSPLSVVDEATGTTTAISTTDLAISEVVETATGKSLTLTQKFRQFTERTTSVLRQYSGPMLKILGYLTTIQFLRETFDPSYSGSIVAVDTNSAGDEINLPSLNHCESIWNFLTMRKSQAYQSLYHDSEFIKAITQSATEIQNSWDVDPLANNLVQQVATQFQKELEISSNLGALRLDLNDNGTIRQTDLYICATGDTSGHNQQSVLFYTLARDVDGTPLHALPLLVALKKEDQSWENLPADSVPQQIVRYWNQGDYALGNDPGANVSYSINVNSGIVSIVRQN